MKKNTISDAALQALKPPPKGQRLVLADDKVPGLSLRVTPEGRMTWSVRTRTKDGKQVRPTIGTYKATAAAMVVMGLSDARKRALAALAGIQAGDDPTAAKRSAEAARLAQEQARTVTMALEAWQAHRKADPKSPWSARYAGEVARLVKREIPAALGKRPLAETTREDWTNLVSRKKQAAPALAASLYRVLSSFLGHAEAMGWIPAPMLARKGSVTIAPMPPSRVRVLTDAELLEVWHATEEEAPKTRAFARLLILTAAREREVADLTAAELDLEAGRWTIPGSRTKNGQPLTLPLAPLAIAELRAAWPEEAPGPEDCLFGKLKTSGFQGFGKLKARIDAKISSARTKAGAPPMPAWRFHDLRRTARTGMTRLGVPRDHAEAAINHISGRSALERTYDRHDYAEEVLGALTRWQAHVAGLVQPNQGAEVVPLRRAG